MKDEEQIALFEKPEKRLRVFIAEFSELAKKRPNDPVNKFKLGLINSSLVELNQVLEEDKPFPDFAFFDLDQLPTNSDVKLILAQYAASVYAHRVANTLEGENGDWFWIVEDELSDIPTEHPHRFEPKA